MEEAARATDDAGLKRAAMELRPGDARWAASMGRFEAKVAQLRLGGETMLEGLGLPLPDPAKPRFHELVQQIYDEIARQCAPEPLLPSGSGQEAETAAPQLALPQPMEVETPAVGPSAAPPAAQAPAPVQAPAAPASPEALPVEDRLAELAGQLQRVVAAAPLDQTQVGRLLGEIERLDPTQQLLHDTGAPRPHTPRTHTRPGAPPQSRSTPRSPHAPARTPRATDLGRRGEGGEQAAQDTRRF